MIFINMPDSFRTQSYDVSHGESWKVVYTTLKLPHSKLDFNWFLSSVFELLWCNYFFQTHVFNMLKGSLLTAVKSTIESECLLDNLP